MTLLKIAQILANSLRVNQPTFDLPAGVDWLQLLEHADGHSLTPLLYDTWHQAGVLAQLPGKVRARMAQVYADNARRNENIRREVLEIHCLLDQANVPHCVLKGWALIEQLYPHPAHRVLYDHDFLVPDDRAEVGHRALIEAGFRPLPGKDEWVEKHLQPLWRNDGYQWDGYLFDPNYPRPVELHVRLWEQGWRGLQVKSLPNLWAKTQTLTIAGTSMQVLSQEDTLVHLAMHFAGHLIEREARLNQLLDLARFVAKIREQETFSWNNVLQQAGAANISRFVYASLFLACQIFGAPLPPDFIWQQLERSTPPAFRVWLINEGVIDVLTSDYRRIKKGRDYQITFLAASNLGERAGIVRFAALPPVEQLMAKYNFRRRWLGPIYYPRHLFERVRDYGRGILR